MLVNPQQELIFFVNGKKVVEKHPDPEWTLVYYLRNKRLCGTKLGCAEGGCGACTVMVSKYDRKKLKVDHLAVNACLAPVCSMHGLAVTTVEGIGSTKTKLHPVQERIARAHGSQCGFCTPGIVMSMYTLLRNHSKPTMKELDTAFQGNLCRCTGYRPIIEGYKTFVEDWEVMQNGTAITTNGNGGCVMGNNCCKMQNGYNSVERYDDDEALFEPNKFTPYDPSQEPIFPPELKLNDTLDKQNLVFRGKDVTWYRPVQLEQLLELKSIYPDARIIVGNTEVGIEVKFKHFQYPVRIQPTQISELTSITRDESGIKIGAAVSLHDLEIALRSQISVLPKYKTRICLAIVEMLNWFAGKQIRNVAAVGGNIMTGSPISDLNQIFTASEAILEVQSKKDGRRSITMDDTFFTGYRQNIIRTDEILISITIPYTKKNQYFYAYKQARRREDDTAIVNSAINVEFDDRSDVIRNINIAFGGMGPTTVTARRTSAQLIGKRWDRNTLELAYNYLIEDLPLSSSAPGGMVQFRRALTLSFFFKAYLSIFRQLSEAFPGINKTIDLRDSSAIEGLKQRTLKSAQYFQVLPSNDKIDAVGRPVPHLSAYKQAAGEAIFCDDMPHFENELYMGLVLSARAHAKLLSIDPSEALQIEGVHAFFSAKDISKEKNMYGLANVLLFADKVVTAKGQIIGIVLAEDQAIAQKASRKVKIAYEDLEPVIVSIEDAIKHNSYFGDFTNSIVNGDVDEVFKTAPHTVENEIRTGGQEHFYLETQCVLAVPKNEDDEIELFCSSQDQTSVTKFISKALGVSLNKIVLRVKRIGGGFGGKEFKSALIAVPAAFAASRTRRPVRCMLDRDEDMLMTGGRHPFYMKYKTAFNDDGKILGCEIYLYNNAGYSSDTSNWVMERAMLNIDNAYKIPNVRVSAYLCKTNLPSNTAFRGFGGPQSNLAAEYMVRQIAEYLNKDVMEISRLNLYREGDFTYYNQKLERCTIERCWDECVQSSNIHARRKRVDRFNKENRWKKRGISVVCSKHGICFDPVFLNQGGALVHVYTDGSVLLTHGGAEMGQGLHTKMIQVASQALQIPMSKIHTSETATDKVPNATTTAASFSSDLNGMAVLNACTTINERLAPYKKVNQEGKWEDWVMAAYLDRVSLSATGFYKSRVAGYNWKTNSGDAYEYFTIGVGCSEVEIDCLTGDHQVLRTDIVMDVGESLNPAIDVGQIEGAFVQGYGLYMIEELMFGPDGSMHTRGPGAYKLPGFNNIPQEFNVSLLKGAPNPRAIYSSKAIGEPPLALASSVLFATREAIKAAREDAGLQSNDFKLDAPVTCAKIRMACQDHLTVKLKQEVKEDFVPWNVVP